MDIYGGGFHFQGTRYDDNSHKRLSGSQSFLEIASPTDVRSHFGVGVRNDDLRLGYRSVTAICDLVMTLEFEIIKHTNLSESYTYNLSHKR